MPIQPQTNAQVLGFIQNLKQPQQQIVGCLRDLIIDAAPEIEERFSYKVPFYYRFGRVFYINAKADVVQLGFCDGHLLADENALLSGHGLKIVRHYEVASLAEVEVEKLKQLLQEALLVNELKQKK